jgi:magnesium transporter
MKAREKQRLGIRFLKPFHKPAPARPIRKTGLPPGSLIYTGQPKDTSVHYEFIRYNAEQLNTLDVTTPPEKLPGYHYWLDVRGIHDLALIESLGKAFDLDPLVLEDIVDPEQRPKFEQLDTGLFIILKHLIPSHDKSEFLSEQISLILTEDRLIIFQEYPDDTFKPLKDRMQHPSSRLRIRKADYLLYTIIDFITDHYFNVIDQCEERIQVLEREIIDHPAHDLKKSIYMIQQDISDVQRLILPAREAVGALLRTDHTLVTDKTKRYLRDVMDNLMQMIDLLHDQNAHLSSIRDLFMSEMTYRMTNVMMVLTVVTTIFIPLTFITSIYGMNFRHMPELEWPWAYGALWIIMLAIAAGQWVYFRRKNWL